MIKWHDIKKDGTPDWCGEYLVRHMEGSWPFYKMANITDVDFFDDLVPIENVTHWAKINAPEIE